MERLFVKFPSFKLLFEAWIVMFASICLAVALNLFYIPSHLFMGGVPGFSQIVAKLVENTFLSHYLTTAIMFFILNIPIITLSFFKLGRRFTILTLCVVGLSTILAERIIPTTIVTNNPLLSAIVGGAILGIGSGFAVKYGMCLGGFDVFALILGRRMTINFGMMTFGLNLIIIVGSGLLYDWETALYTMIAIYVVGLVSDKVHTGEQKMTAFIITNHAEDVSKSIQRAIVRGITILDAKGAYSGQPRKVLMMVLNRHEMHLMQMAVAQVDPTAFIDVVPSARVTGNYLTPTQQQESLKQRGTIS